MSETSLIQLSSKDARITQALYGPNDQHLKRLEEELAIQLVTRGEDILITGEKAQIDKAARVLNTLAQVVEQHVQIAERDVVYAVQLEKEDKLDDLNELYDEKVATTIKGKLIKAKTLGQRHYISLIKKNDMVFGVGPAGTGKTYLAVVMAVTALKEGHVQRIVLTRPAVEAGESLVFYQAT